MTRREPCTHVVVVSPRQFHVDPEEAGVVKCDRCGLWRWATDAEKQEQQRRRGQAASQGEAT